LLVATAAASLDVEQQCVRNCIQPSGVNKIQQTKNHGCEKNQLNIRKQSNLVNRDKEILNEIEVK